MSDYANIFERLDNELTDGDGYWSRGSQNTVHETAKQLLLIGMGEDDVAKLIGELWFACRREYGD